MQPKSVKISIVTCSYNQGQFIAQTIDSVLRQRYPNVEHIVVDGMSTDDTPDVLARYPHLKVIREPDRGQADAINKGLRMATGDIMCFLNSDDTLEPDTLMQVAREIDPAAGRYIVMGRCRFVDSDGASTGIEHPSFFEDHERVLAIWKGYCIAQPAVFWAREVYTRCGGLNESEELVLDYELFCRYSQHYRFHTIDQLFATYRLHESSKSVRATNSERLEDSIRVSRHFWPGWLSPVRWRLEGSLMHYRINRKYRAACRIAQARESVRNGRPAAAVPPAMLAALIGPDVVWSSIAYPRLRDYVARVAPRAVRMIFPRSKSHATSPQTRAYINNVEAWPDGWVGPKFVRTLSCATAAQGVFVVGETNVEYLGGPLHLTLSLDDAESNLCTVSATGHFRCEIRPKDGIALGEHTFAILANRWFVPHHFASNEDHRPLAWRLIECNFVLGIRTERP